NLISANGVAMQPFDLEVVDLLPNLAHGKPIHHSLPSRFQPQHVPDSQVSRINPPAWNAGTCRPRGNVFPARPVLKSFPFDNPERMPAGHLDHIILNCERDEVTFMVMLVALEDKT